MQENGTFKEYQVIKLPQHQHGPINTYQFNFLLVDGTYKQWTFDVISHSVNDIFQELNHNLPDKPITGKRIYSEIDPYGEESWEDDI
jgi:hypothetical protein